MTSSETVPDRVGESLGMGSAITRLIEPALGKGFAMTAHEIKSDKMPAFYRLQQSMRIAISLKASARQQVCRSLLRAESA